MTYNILFATDENYIQHTSVTIISLLENNKELSIKIYYILDKISEENQLKLNTLIDKYDCKIEFITIEGDQFNLFPTGFHFNKSVYYRLMMATVILDDYVLYMDSDIVVNGSIKKIFNTGNNNSFLAAVLNPGFNRHSELNINNKAKYFNAGLIYANLRKWRNEKIFENCIEYINNNHSNIILADQDVLNAVVNGKWKELDLKYNQQAMIFEDDFIEKYNDFSDHELNDAKFKPIIIHYSGSSKPWHFRNNHPYKKLYWQYLKQTPFKRYFPEDLTFINILKWLIPQYIKNFIKENIKLK